MWKFWSQHSISPVWRMAQLSLTNLKTPSGGVLVWSVVESPTGYCAIGQHAALAALGADGGERRRFVKNHPVGMHRHGVMFIQSPALHDAVGAYPAIELATGAYRPKRIGWAGLPASRTRRLPSIPRCRRCLRPQVWVSPALTDLKTYRLAAWPVQKSRRRNGRHWNPSIQPRTVGPQPTGMLAARAD